MNLQQKRQQLRELIPTSKELAFGCEIYTGIVVDEAYRKRERVVSVSVGSVANGITTNKGEYVYGHKSSCQPIVIGHPPQLNDLLLALGGYWALEENNFVRLDGACEYWRSETYYDRTADPLSQDEQTTDELIELLKCQN